MTEVAKAGTPVGSRGTRDGYTNYSIPITLATELTAAFEGDVTISVSGTDAAGNEGVAQTLVVGLKVAKGSDAPDTGDDPLKDFVVPAKSYVIVAKTDPPDGLPSAFPANTAEGSTATAIKKWAHMPDLENLFYEGGSLLLTTLKATELDRDGDEDATPAVAAADQTAKEAAKARDVLITEIMAARNTAKVGTGDYLKHQWIEIYNKLPVDVKVTLSQKAGHPAPATAATEVQLDLVSNEVDAGWNFTGLGADGFDSGPPDPDTGATAAPVLEPFESFYRNNRGEPGWQKNRWTTSTTTYFVNHKGTPGAIERTLNAPITATAFVDSPIQINEVSTDGDWFELKNTATSGDPVSLNNYQLSQSTALDNDDRLVSFGGKDYKVPAGGVILIVSGTNGC